MNSPLSAREIVSIIRNAGAKLPDDTVDMFQAGNPDTLVRGIAVTMMPTLDVLQRAVAADCNFVIAHEPAFYNHREETAPLERDGDAVLRAKRAFIAQHGLVLWRFHDAPHRQTPDAITHGVAAALGWGAFQSAKDERLFVVPEISLNDLALELRDKLNAQTVRVVGDGTRRVSQIALAVGAPGFEAHRRLLSSHAVEVMVIGEAWEWETIAYAADAASAGFNKSLIVVGHIPSEQDGMKACARWFETLLPNVPITFVATRELFWLPHRAGNKNEF